MGSVAVAMAMSHAPLMVAESAVPPEEQTSAVGQALNRLSDELTGAAPDLLLAIIDDHFENFFRPLMPSFALAVGESNFGPPDHYVEWLGIERREIRNDPDFASALFAHAIDEGFDLVRAERVALGHALMVPMEILKYAYEVPVVPLLTNVFTAPAPSIARAMDLGACIRRFIAERPERVGVVATGALSHWPPYWRPGIETDPFLERMRRFQEGGLPVLEGDPDLYADFGAYENEMAASGQRVINADWDRQMLDLFEAGDLESLRALTYEDVCEGGGHGGYEVLNWAMLAAVMGGAPAQVVAYEAVREWIGGIGVLRYEAQTELAAAGPDAKRAAA